MVNFFIRSMIGSWGNVILDYYIANSFWINALLLLYALLVVFARMNFDLSLRSLVAMLQNQYAGQLAQKNSGGLLNKLKKGKIPWDEALATAQFPFMTPPGSYWVYPKNSKIFQKFTPIEKLAELLQNE